MNQGPANEHRGPHDGCCDTALVVSLCEQLAQQQVRLHDRETIAMLYLDRALKAERERDVLQQKCDDQAIRIEELVQSTTDHQQQIKQLLEQLVEDIDAGAAEADTQDDGDLRHGRTAASKELGRAIGILERQHEISQAKLETAENKLAISERLRTRQASLLDATRCYQEYYWKYHGQEFVLRRKPVESSSKPRLRLGYKLSDWKHSSSDTSAAGQSSQGHRIYGPPPAAVDHALVRERLQIEAEARERLRTPEVFATFDNTLGSIMRFRQIEGGPYVVDEFKLHSKLCALISQYSDALYDLPALPHGYDFLSARPVLNAEIAPPLRSLLTLWPDNASHKLVSANEISSSSDDTIIKFILQAVRDDAIANGHDVIFVDMNVVADTILVKPALHALVERYQEIFEENRIRLKMNDSLKPPIFRSEDLSPDCDQVHFLVRIPPMHWICARIVKQVPSSPSAPTTACIYGYCLSSSFQDIYAAYHLGWLYILMAQNPRSPFHNVTGGVPIHLSSTRAHGAPDGGFLAASRLISCISNEAIDNVPKEWTQEMCEEMDIVGRLRCLEVIERKLGAGCPKFPIINDIAGIDMSR